VAFLPDSRLLAIQTDDDISLHLWTSSSATIRRLKPTLRSLQRIGFSPDGLRLLTDCGELDVANAPLSLAVQHPTAAARIFLGESWITFGGEDILWYPPSYRVQIREGWNWIHGIDNSTIALTSGNGTLVLMSLDTRRLADIGLPTSPPRPYKWEKIRIRQAIKTAIRLFS
jgi:hypothetical protein